MKSILLASHVTYRISGRMSLRQNLKPPPSLFLLHDISMELAPCETVGLVGPSGSGKSTLARALLALLPLTSGELSWRLNGESVNPFCIPARFLRRARRQFQVVFQNPYAALNSRQRVRQILAQPFCFHYPDRNSSDVEKVLQQALDEVALPAGVLDRHPEEFSGGQRQRICLARALLLEPKLLILDEVTALLDVTVQAEIIRLLRQIQERRQISMLFITHNILLAREFCGRILVMDQGRLVDKWLPGESPEHPTTRQLLAATLSIYDRFVNSEMTG
jgi:ABC-type glutathione transport system ATPase component